MRFGREASREPEHVPIIDVHRCNGFAREAIVSHQAARGNRSILTDVRRLSSTLGQKTSDGSAGIALNLGRVCCRSIFMPQ